MQDGKLYTLIPLLDFKAVLGADDREDALSRYCLVTATYAIEHYCKRRLIRKRHTDFLTFTGDYLFPLREYPVRQVLGVSVLGQPVDSENFYCIPDEGSREEIPFSLVLQPPKKLGREAGAVRVHYKAGYLPGKAPPDLEAAGMELASWNMARYRSRRIGVTGNVRRGSGNEGEHFEASMPENVKQLLEPYVRRTI